MPPPFIPFALHKRWDRLAVKLLAHDVLRLCAYRRDIIVVINAEEAVYHKR